MPEGPECKLTVEYILIGNAITKWIFCYGKYTDDYPYGYSDFSMKLPLVVKEVKCKGKFIYFIFMDNYYILHSMMMTGKWTQKYDIHCKWYLEVISGCGNYLKAEVLYHAKISPLRRLGSLKEQDVE